jgi:hypothetical protein
MEAKAKTRSELHRLIDELPEAETQAARRYLEYLRDRGLPGLKELLEAPEEEEELSDEGRRRLEEGLEDLEASRTVSDEDVRRELGW